MHYKVVFLHQAKMDLVDLKNYILRNFSQATWKTSYEKIKTSINTLITFPQAGSIPHGLENLNLTQFRQIISGLNRIIYEVKETTVYIHIICDTRRDMTNLLVQRLLRMT